MCDRPIRHDRERPSDEEGGKGDGEQERGSVVRPGSRARNGVERRRGKEKGRIGVWMLWECKMGMYYTEGVGLEEREQDESQDMKGGCMRGWWYKDD